MTKEILQSLINRVIGSKGILRAPAWWVRRLFNEIIEFNEADASKKSNNALLTAQDYVDNALNDVKVTVDSAMSDTSTNPVQNKVVKSFVEMPIKTLDVTGGAVTFDSRTYYKFDVLYEPLVISLNDSSGVGMYMFEFEVTSYVTYIGDFDVILPEGVNWANGASPIFDPGIRYQVTITNSIAEIQGDRKSVQDYAKELNIKELTFIALDDDWQISVPHDMEYSIDGESWQFIGNGFATPSINKWHYISFRCSLEKGEKLSYMTAYKICYVTGSVMSLVHSSNYDLYHTLEGYDSVFTSLFAGKDGGDHEILGVSDDLLPATTLSEGCYAYMFNGGHILRNAPTLPASTLTSECYSSMFQYCNFKTAPELPAKTLGTSCYSSMFYNCKKLITMPHLPATILSEWCYSHMFDQCSNLVRVGFLPATYGAEGCYNSMFKNCTSLSKAPLISLNSLAAYSLGAMFSGCTNLVSPADLYITELTESTVYDSGACASMYANCSSLEYGPIIKTPAITMSKTFANMFDGCSKLKYIILNTPSVPSSGFTDWVNGVAESGIFIKPADTTLPVGTYGVPEGWTLKDIKEMYITMEALEDGLTASLSDTNCEYSLDGIEWTALPAGELSPSVNTGETISFRSKSPTMKSNGAGIGTFTVNKGFSMRGNVMSILYGDSAYKIEVINIPLNKLFKNCTSLKSVAADFLPAKQIDAWRAYRSMFEGCTSLENAPELPGTIPLHLAGTTGDPGSECYRDMFKGCTSLVVAPSLPSPTLNRFCYDSMFYGCTSLTTAPELPVTTLAEYCYQYMFFGCTNLSYIKMMATKISAYGCLNDWVKSVASSGTFVKNSAATWNVTGVSGVPEGWTVETADV